MKITRKQLRTLIESVLREEKDFDLSKVIDYTVKSGDTLAVLNKSYGAEDLGFTVEDQIELNKKENKNFDEAFYDGDKLRAGKVIKLRVDSAVE